MVKTKYHKKYLKRKKNSHNPKINKQLNLKVGKLHEQAYHKGYPNSQQILEQVPDTLSRRLKQMKYHCGWLKLKT